MLYHRLTADIDNQNGIFHREPFSLKEIISLLQSFSFTITDQFVHSEVCENVINNSEIDAMAERLRKKISLMHGTDHYYFFKNKADEIINILRTKGVHLPQHAVFILKPV